ncbi:thioredoxin domain-containing protein [Candidatus Daviesbacteria bacterium]|nr:thioredoxin domain-containing protein [Candidatus Daviesbacteria bacterium]
MRTETKILGIGLFITLIILGGGLILATKGQSSDSKTVGSKVYSIDYSKGQKIGSDSAKVKLVEFSDFQCPACAAAEPFVRQIRDTYPDEVLFVYRHFPLSQHQNARKAATVAEAAGEQGKFWQMDDKLFETQSQWENLPNPDTFFIDLAKQLGVDEKEIQEALSKDPYKQKVDEDVAEGISLGVNSTPTFFLNGRKLDLRTFNDIRVAVESELQKNQ